MNRTEKGEIVECLFEQNAEKGSEVRFLHIYRILFCYKKAELATDKSAQAGPRAARRAVQLLVKLRRSSRACDLFLQHRRAILHGAMK